MFLKIAMSILTLRIHLMDNLTIFGLQKSKNCTSILLEKKIFYQPTSLCEKVTGIHPLRTKHFNVKFWLPVNYFCTCTNSLM